MRSILENISAFGLNVRNGLQLGTVTQTLTGTFNMAADGPPLLLFDCGAAGRTVVLPSILNGTGINGRSYTITNMGAANNITLNAHADESSALVATLTPGQQVTVFASSAKLLWYPDTGTSSPGAVVTDVEQFVCLTANGPTDNNSLLDSAVAAAVFRTPANGALTVAASTTYMFEAMYYLSNTGTTSHTWSTLFGGTATFTSVAYLASAYTGTTSGATITAMSAAQVAVATAVAVTAASTSATEFCTFWLRGVIRINAAGTLIPQLKASARPGASGTPGVTILAGSYFRAWPVGSDTVASVGNWT